MNHFSKLKFLPQVIKTEITSRSEVKLSSDSIIKLGERYYTVVFAALMSLGLSLARVCLNQ